MKNKLARMLAVTMAVALPISGLTFTGAAESKETAPQDPRGRLMAGAMISCTAEPKAAEVVVNNKGMSGLDSYIHLHNTTDANSYKSTIAGKRGAVTFSFSQIESLGYMYVWNYNALGQLDCGMKDVKIQYSIDKENWFDLTEQPVRLARALENENDQHGGNAANNLADGCRTPIDFGGLPAQYVRIIPQTNYGGDGYGLSEVRFFRFKTRPKTGSLLASNARAPKSAASAVNLANNYGLSDLISADAVHTNAPETMWLSEDKAEDSFVVIDLDGTYPVSKMALWNYNAPDKLDCGMNKIKVEYTTKRPYTTNDQTIDYANGEWTLLGEYDLPKASGQDKLAASLSIDFKNSQAQYIRITPISNHGGSGYGLSAVRVFSGGGWAVEPSRDWSQLFSCEGSFDYQTSGFNKRDKTGWLLADGVYTVNMNGNDRVGSSNASTKTAFLFSDTLMGNLNNYRGTRGKYGSYIQKRSMNNNSFATLVGNKPDPRNFQFYLNNADSYDSMLGNGNWAQELVRIGKTMYAWCFPTQNWSATKFILNKFEPASSGLPDLSKKPAQQDMNFLHEFDENGTHYRIEFSCGVMNNTADGGATPTPDGYIYAYGLKSYSAFILIKCPVVARVKAEDFEDLSKWRFYDGENWVEDIEKCAPIDGGDGMVSNEYSVSYMESGTFAGKYVMNYTYFTQSTRLALAVSDTPYGPFNNKNCLSLYDCPDVVSIRELNNDNKIYAYNSKAHPHLSADGELLISYNLNSGNFDTQRSFEFLHPMFVTLFDVKDTVNTIESTVCEDGDNLITAQNVSDPQAADGDLSTTVTMNAPGSFTIDFKTPTETDKLVINWSSATPKKAPDGYTVEYSTDGTNWKDTGAVYRYSYKRTQDKLTYSTDTATFDKITAQYLRINIAKSSSASKPVIREIKAYNTALKPVPAPNAFTPDPLPIGAEGDTDTDYTALEAKAAEIDAAGLISSQYTAASWKAFADALKNVKDALQSAEEKTQEEIDALVDTLTKAFGGLVKNPPAPKPEPKPEPKPIVKPVKVEAPAKLKKFTAKKKGRKITLTIKKSASKNKTYIEYRKGNKGKFKKLTITAKTKFTKKFKKGKYQFRAYSYIKVGKKAYKSKKYRTVKVTVK